MTLKNNTIDYNKLNDWFKNKIDEIQNGTGFGNVSVTIHLRDQRFWIEKAAKETEK